MGAPWGVRPVDLVLWGHESIGVIPRSLHQEPTPITVMTYAFSGEVFHHLPQVRSTSLPWSPVTFCLAVFSGGMM